MPGLSVVIVIVPSLIRGCEVRFGREFVCLTYSWYDSCL